MKPFTTMAYIVFSAGLCTSLRAEETNNHPPIRTPAFADYAVASNAKTTPRTAKAPILDTKISRLYRTVIRTEFQEPANFAGHYRVAIWGCGSDCRNFAILDKETGRVYTMPGVDNIVGMEESDDDRLAFRKDSRLFVITGCFNEDCDPEHGKAGKFYYEWTGRELRQIHVEPATIKHVDAPRY